MGIRVWWKGRHERREKKRKRKEQEDRAWEKEEETRRESYWRYQRERAQRPQKKCTHMAPCFITHF